MNATAAADLTPFHHPHCLEGRRDTEYRFGTRYFFRFLPFTGGEPEPDMPDGLWGEVTRVSEDYYLAAGVEYRLAYDLWAQTRFRRDVTPVLRDALAVWQEYERARNAMAAAFAAFWDTSDLSSGGRRSSGSPTPTPRRKPPRGTGTTSPRASPGPSTSTCGTSARSTNSACGP